jgi:proline iminopeptidase
MKAFLLICTFLCIFILLKGQEICTFRASDGEMIHYTKYGEGPRVVLLYGGPGYDVSAMQFWADSLSGLFECILYDQRGTGLSSDVKMDATTINLKRAVEDLDDLRIHLDEKQLVLCGISWGGMLAQAYAACFPENTGRIVLVSTLGPDLSLMAAFTDNMNMRRFPEERDSLAYWRNQPDSDHSIMKRAFYNYIPEFYDHEIGNKMLPEFFRTTTLNDQMSRLMWTDLYENYDLTSTLDQYTGESVIIRPRQDPAPAEAIYQIKELLPQTQIIFIEKCGHFPDYEKPEEFFRILRKVLE